ncbi:MAG TPA: hypothetical protein VFQ65_18320 [Kofleriaceae bacterium]|nr:hypothetical protein [Kofleriaceae bacterium]
MHHLDELERDHTTAFERVATRHHQARVSRRVIALAVIALVAVLAARAAAAPAAPVVVVPSDCDPESGCDDGANDGANDSANEGDDDSGNSDARVELIPRVVKRPRVAQLEATPCDCPHVLPLTITEVTAAAVRAAGLDHDPTGGWNTRARLAGLVPMFSARVGRNLTWKEVDDPTLGYTNMYDVRGTWHLERLLFDPNEIRIAAIDVSRRREKRRVEMLAAHTYLAWAKVPRTSERAELLAADLDALTEGWFSRALAKPGKP